MIKNISSVFIYPVLLTIVIVLLYHKVVHNGFSGLDDLLMIEENWDNLTQLNHIYTAFTNDVFNGVQGTYYRPIQILSYMPDAYIINSPTPEPQVFFIINIILFTSAIILLYFFLSCFGFSANYRFIFSFIFAIHPALTPAVAWIPGRVDIVLFILVISSLWSFVTYYRTRNIFWGIASILFFGLGLFNKETAIVVPLVSLLYVVYQMDIISNSTRWKWTDLILYKTWKPVIITGFNWAIKNWWIVASWGFVVILFFVLRNHALPDNPFGLISILSKIGFSWKQFIVMLGITYLPLQLQVFLDVTWIYMLWAIPGFILFLVLPLKINTSFKNVFFGSIWIFLFLFPTTLSDLLNYHRMFLPLVGIAFLLAPLDQIKSKRTKNFTLVLVVGFAFTFVLNNISFQRAFVNREVFWKNAIEYSPNSILSNGGMAWVHHSNHQNDSALYYYDRMIKIRPNRSDTRLGMAIIAEEMGKTELADSLLQDEFTVTLDSANVYYYIGQILLERTDTVGAIQNLQLGYPVVEYSRNARIYFDTLDVKVKSKLDIQLGN